MQNKTLHNLFFSSPDAQTPECLIFSTFHSPRLEYTCKFIFNTVLSLNYRITASSEEFNQNKALKINYSNLSFNAGLQILPIGLLSETGLSENKPELLLQGNLYKAYVIGQSSTINTLEYDLFSMVFYFISRYEEWQNFDKDEHGRFTMNQSILYKYKILQFPLLDLCIMELKEKLHLISPETQWPKKSPQLFSSIDVDNLYAFRGRPIWKTLAAGLRDILKADGINLMNRLKVLSGKQKDPFDIYDEVPAFCENESISLFFFFLYRNGTKYDRGLRPGGAAFREVFRRLKKHAVGLGLHPSYDSNKEAQLNNELQQLQSDLGEEVKISRQHYLRFDIQKTPKSLMEAGIKTDFSMGFSDTPGFRAGTSFPFHYYDFEKEQPHNLLFVPFCMMDGAYSIHQKKDRELIMMEMLDMAKQVKKCGGNFVSVFHERSFYNHLYPGMGTLYKEMHLQIKALFTT